MDHDSAEPQTPTRREVLTRASTATAMGVAGATTVPSPVAARRCDAAVPADYATIQAAVDDADPGDVICVRGGTYPENVTVDREVTLRGQAAPGSANAAVLDGRLSVDPAGSGTTVRRLKVAPTTTYEGGTFPDPFGVRVVASDVTVERNVIEGLRADLSNGEGSFTLHGVQVFGAEGANVSNVTVRGNVIRGFRSEGDPDTWPKYGGIAGVKVQANATDVTVRGNRITDHHSAGWVWGFVLTSSASASGVPQGVTVQRNHVSGLNDGSVYDVFTGANEGRDSAPYPGSAFGIDGAADAGAATVRRNDLLAPNGAESKDQDGTLVATCNWWGEKSGPTHGDNPDGTGTWALERGSATIEYQPWLVAPAPSRACVGGQRDDGGNRGGR